MGGNAQSIDIGSTCSFSMANASVAIVALMLCLPATVNGYANITDTPECQCSLGTTGACIGDFAGGCEKTGGTFITTAQPDGCCCCKPSGKCWEASIGACGGRSAYGCHNDGGTFVYYPDNKTMEGCCCLGGGSPPKDDIVV